VLRIWPAYFTFLAVAFALRHWQSPGGHPWTLGSTASALVFVHNYYMAVGGPAHETGIGHLWSVSAEEQFYLLWPLVLGVLLARGTRTAAVALTGFALAVLAWRSLLFAGFDVGAYYVYFAFDTRADSLAIGCLIALWSTQPGFDRYAAALAARAWAPLVTLVAIAVTSNLPEWCEASLGWTVQPLLMAVLIVQLLQLHRHPAWAWLEAPVPRYLGAISYPLYLYHGLAIAAGRHALPSHASPYPQFLVAVLAAVAMASASYYVIERPFLRWKDRLGERPLGRTPLQAVA
jgi:peptidoglycan/LPS O-acetylase OafA/YrhL